MQEIVSNSYFYNFFHLSHSIFFSIFFLESGHQNCEQISHSGWISSSLEGRTHFYSKLLCLYYLKFLYLHLAKIKLSLNYLHTLTSKYLFAAAFKDSPPRYRSKSDLYICVSASPWCRSARIDIHRSPIEMLNGIGPDTNLPIPHWENILS